MAGKYSSEEMIEQRRSRVRVVVTYLAALYIFIGSGALIAALWIEKLPDDKLSTAKDVFTMVMPVAAGIIAYWFASRKPSSSAFTSSGGELEKRGDSSPQDPTNG